MKPTEIIDKYKNISKYLKELEFVNKDISQKMVISFGNWDNDHVNIEVPKEIKSQIQDLVRTWLTNELIKKFEI